MDVEDFRMYWEEQHPGRLLTLKEAEELQMIYEEENIYLSYPRPRAGRIPKRPPMKKKRREPLLPRMSERAYAPREG